MIKAYNAYHRGIFIEFFRLIGIVSVTVLAVNYTSTVTRVVQPWLSLNPVLTAYVVFWLFFLSLLFVMRLLLKGVAQIIKWERVHRVTQWVALSLGALQGLWWAGFVVLALSTSGFTYLEESVEQRSVAGPRLLSLSRDNLERLSGLFPGGQDRDPALIPPATAVPR